MPLPQQTNPIQSSFQDFLWRTGVCWLPFSVHLMRSALNLLARKWAHLMTESYRSRLPRMMIRRVLKRRIHRRKCPRSRKLPGGRGLRWSSTGSIVSKLYYLIDFPFKKYKKTEMWIGKESYTGFFVGIFLLFRLLFIHPSWKTLFFLFDWNLIDFPENFGAKDDVIDGTHLTSQRYKTDISNTLQSCSSTFIFHPTWMLFKLKKRKESRLAYGPV